ncbi:MAG TPA: DUF1501 domain-containing protein [Isosphaeraceae bacterium]|jgi:uncharacterized protein (DUF1501 family)|nr:DUF1501 domain-containing protein [Isosphaeraceae bacterium]
MLTFWDEPRRHCDRVGRRDFLRVGALGLGGITLADVLRLRATAGQGSSTRAVIMVCLAGGPSHIDMYDLKPDAAPEVRGDFKPIATNVPGLDLCELFPLQAKVADKLALVRTVQFVEPMQHELQECYTGFPRAARRPAFGSVISRYRRDRDRLLPAYVSLDEYYGNHAELEHPQYVGEGYRPFLYGGEAIKHLGLLPEVGRRRLDDRKGLMASFDRLRREADALGNAEAVDAFTAQALDIITSPRARAAFDLGQEPGRVRAKYGSKDDKYIYGNEPKPTVGWPSEKFLLARRLVEAGVSVVTMRIGTWDYHGTTSGTGNIFTGLRSQLPLLDRSIHALVTDLHERGLDREVAVLVWGEFGRTPRVNNVEGRDHWPEAGFALFAGGGLRTGQVVGATDSKGERPKSRPLGAQNVLGTLYHALGIDPSWSLPDFSGRPLRLLDDGEPIAELV